MDRIIERVVAILALWKLGLACLPLGQRMPAERVSEILAEAHPIAAIVTDEFIPFLNSVCSHHPKFRTSNCAVSDLLPCLHTSASSEGTYFTFGPTVSD